MVDADVFAGVSVGGLVTKDMVASMAERPILMAMANPDPEITYEDAASVREDVIMATGRSDYPNQVNNVLGFPFIFRGALDVRARAINEEMKIAAVKSLAELAKEDVPDSVIKAYGGKPIHFGKDYIIPKPFDPRVLTWEAVAVAKAAVDTGVARKPISDWDAYRNELEGRLGKSYSVMRGIISKAQSLKKRLVLPEGTDIQVLRATQILLDEKIADVVLLGNKDEINALAQDNGLHIENAEIVDLDGFSEFESYVDELHRLRRRKGITRSAAKRMLTNNANYLGAMMVRMGFVDSMLSGESHYYPEVIRPALEVMSDVGRKTIVAGVYAIILNKEMLFFADTTVNVDPSAETLAQIAILTAEEVKRTFDVDPNIAMLSFSNFGSSRNANSAKMAQATAIVKEMHPELNIDGEVQVDLAFDVERREKFYEFSSLKGRANVLIFPNLEAGNIAYKLMGQVGGAETIGPILVGMDKPVHVLQRNSDVDTIVRMAAIAVTDTK